MAQLSDKDIADRDKDKRTGRLVWVISRISNRFRNPIMADVYNSQREVMYGVHEFEHKERVVSAKILLNPLVWLKPYWNHLCLKSSSDYSTRHVRMMVFV